MTAKSLLIFDRDCDLRATVCRPALDGGIDIFPLTGDWQLIEAVKKKCEDFYRHVTVVDSARLIDKEVEVIRSKISDWSADLGDCFFRGKSVKEWLLLPGECVSAWWFSPLSEKNALKTDIFLRMAQLQAIDKTFASGEYGCCLLSMKKSEFMRAVEQLHHRYFIRIDRLCGSNRQTLNWHNLKKSIKELDIVGDLLDSLYQLISYARHWYLVRMSMGALRKYTGPDNSMLFTSYFPLIDQKSAEQGIFCNKYALHLEDKLKENGKTIYWLLMYVSFDGCSYSEALKLGKRFLDRGEKIFFLEEFLSKLAFIRVLYTWLLLAIKYFLVLRKIGPHFLTNRFTIPESNQILWPVWRRTFLGWDGLQGILYYEVFRNVFKHFNTAPHCLYYTEMHAWEKALNAARKKEAPNTKTIGFQHTSVSQNYFFYFHTAKETKRTRQPAELPLPDILACNGDGPYRLLSRSEYPGLQKVEALRHFYLNKILKKSALPKTKPPTLLVVGTINKMETKSIVRLILATYRKPQSFNIWFKPHPAMPIGTIFENDGKTTVALDSWIDIRKEPIGELLEQAAIVLVGVSSTAIDALAHGCKVLIPVLSDAMCLNPLSDYPDLCHKIYGPDDLRKCVENIAESEPDPKTIERGKDFVASYWILDESMALWLNLLNC